MFWEKGPKITASVVEEAETRAVGPFERRGREPNYQRRGKNTDPAVWGRDETGPALVRRAILWPKSPGWHGSEGKGGGQKNLFKGNTGTKAEQRRSVN